MKIFRTWSFRWWEVSLMKISLIALGILLGVYFYEALSGLMWLWWTLVVAIAAYFVFFYLMRQE